MLDIKGHFHFVDAYKFGFDTYTSCMIVLTGSILMDAYNNHSVSKLILEPGDVFLFVENGGSHDACKLLYKWMQQGKVSYELIVDECFIRIFDSVGRMFDRGKGLKLIKGYLLFDGEYIFCFDRVFTYGSFLINVDSISMAYYDRNFFHELINMNGFESDILFGDSILSVLVKTGVNSRLLVEISEMNRMSILLLVRVVEIEMAVLRGRMLESAGWSLTSGETNTQMQLQPGIPNARAVLLGKFLEVSVVEHVHGIMLPERLKEFNFLWMLVFSVPAILRAYSHYSRMGYLLHYLLLAPNVYGHLMMPLGIKLASLYFNLSCLQTFYYCQKWSLASQTGEL